MGSDSALVTSKLKFYLHNEFQFKQFVKIDWH